MQLDANNLTPHSPTPFTLHSRRSRRESTMVGMPELDVSDNHPLALELTSLRTAVTRFQHEAHAASVKLQRHSLDASTAYERAQQLDRENALLRTELAALRASPHPDGAPAAHPAALQVQQLTISLRRLSDTLALTEEALHARTAELAHARADAARARAAADSAYELAARGRGREEEGLQRERGLARRVRAAEEERRMADLAVSEYADLVRSLEGRAPHSRFANGDSGSPSSPGASAVTLVDSLSEGKSGLQRLLKEFSGQTERLEGEVARLHGELVVAEAKRDVEARAAERDRAALAAAQFALEKHRLDDSAAAKMVARYMKFSQAATDTLQSALASLKGRHAATLATLASQLEHAGAARVNAERAAERLRGALDELSADIARETYGRRREVALRIGLVAREERTSEALARWLRRAREALARGGAAEDFARVVDDAAGLLTSGGESTDADSESLARVIAAQGAVDMLVDELQEETARRLELERIVAYGGLREASVSEEQDGLELLVEPPISPLDMGESTIHVEPIASAVVSPSEEADPARDGTNASADYTDETPVDGQLPSRSHSVESSLLVNAKPSGSTDSSIVDQTLAYNANASPIINAQSTLQPVDLPLTLHDNAPSQFIDGVDDLTSSSTSLELGAPTKAPDTNVALIEQLPVELLELPNDRKQVEPEVVLSAATSHHVPLDTSFGQPQYALDSVSVTLPATPSGDSAAEHPVAMTEDEPIFYSRNTPAQLPNGAYTNGSSSSSHTSPSPSQPAYELQVPEVPDIASVIDNPLDSPTPRHQNVERDHAAASLAPVAFPSLFPSPALPSAPLQPNPLLADLERVRHRYDDLQRAFRDCHLALQDLRQILAPATGAPPPALQAVLERLDDYTEDARVELEIRAADEALLARGFEALLTVPGALAADAGADAERQIAALTGTASADADAGVQRALDGFTRKLADVQHDIAALKRAVHSAALDAAPVPAPAPAAPPHAEGGWSSWIRGSPVRAGASPAPPTFGSVMTAPRSPSARGGAGEGVEGDVARLGLRVPMPGYVHAAPAPAAPRPRTLSAMYVLGLGARGALPPASQAKARAASEAWAAPVAAAGEDSDAEDGDSDVE